MSVTRSVDNKNIMIMTLPPIHHRIPDPVILEELQRILDGVSGVKRVKRKWLKVGPRILEITVTFFSQVEFLSHQKAAMARKQIVPNTGNIFGYASIKRVEWADPDMEGVIIPKKKLFLRTSGPAAVSEEAVRSLFNSLSGDQVREVGIGPKYGFISFASHEAAKEVMESEERFWVEGVRLRVDWWGPGERKEPSRPLYYTPCSCPSEELLRLSKLKGWGFPQYRLHTTVDTNLQPRYQYSVAFTSLPFKIIGQAGKEKDVAFTSCVKLALQEVSRGNLLVSSRPPLFQYIPHSLIPFTPTSQ